MVAKDRSAPLALVAAEPAVEVSRVEDEGHAVVYFRHQFVGLGVDDAVALQPLAICGGPSTHPEAGKSPSCGRW